MAVRITQLAYNSGELSELMAGRADDTKYAYGLARCENAIITPQGPLKNRAGLMYVNRAKYSDRACRLIPFTYSADQTMIIELGHKYARFHTKGKTLMIGSVPYEIATPWEDIDLFEIHHVQNADVMTLVHSKYPPHELRRYSINDWRCEPVVINTQLKPPTGVTATRVTLAADDKNSEKYTQSYVVTSLNEDRTEESVSSDVATVIANLYATGTTVSVSWGPVSNASFYRVYKLQGGIYGYIGETKSTSIVDDNIAPETGQTPPYLDDIFKMAKGISSVNIVSGGSGYEDTTTTLVGLDMGNAKVTARWWDSGDGKWRYSYVDVPFYEKTPIPVSSTVAYPYKFAYNILDANPEGTGLTVEEDLYSVDAGGDGWKDWYLTNFHITNEGTGYTQATVECLGYGYKGTPDRWMYKFTIPVKYAAVIKRHEVAVKDATGYGAKIYALSTNGVITSVVIESGGTNYTNPTLTVVSDTGNGAILTATVSEVGDYPAAVGYFEQRRVFAGTPQRPQQIWMTKTGTENNMSYRIPIKDDDRISFKVASRDLNQIQHVIALQQLVMLTSAAEWRVSPLNSDAITPSSISVRPLSYVGASAVQPVIVNNTLIYPAARGGHLQEFAYNYQAGGYVSGDLSIRAAHLFDDLQIKDLAYAKAPFPVIWCVSSSGKLLGLTYVPEQQVGAWHRHTTDGVFESCAVVQEGEEDYLYVVVKRKINGAYTRFIERLSSRKDVAVSKGQFLDCSAFYSGEATTEVSGIDWLNGAVVTAVANGVVVKGLTVENGKIKLPVAATDVSVGLPYSMTVETLPIAVSLQDGSVGRGHVKNVNKVWVRLYNTSGLSVGPTETSQTVIAPRKNEAYGMPSDLRTGEFDTGIAGRWGKDGRVVMVQRYPLPVTIISTSAEVEIGG